MLKNIGSFAVVIGVLALVLNYFDRVPKVLVWIYNWGEGTAMLIKIGLIVVGGILWALGTYLEKDSQAPTGE